MPRMRSFSGSSSPAKISVAESNPSSPGGTGADEGSAMATTPASSASDLRLVRTGDTTIPSGVQTRRKRGGSDDMSMVPAVPSQVKVGPSSSSTADASAQAAEADDGGLGMFSAALGTIKEWTNDLMTAPDHLNLTSPAAADGGGDALGGDDNDREVGNTNVDGRSKSGRAGSKLRAAVRSLSPLGRDKVAMNRMKQKLVKAKKAMGGSPDRRSSPNRSSSSGAAAPSTSKRDLQDQFRTKLQVQTNYDVHGELLGTNDHPNDNEDDDGRAQEQKRKKRSGSAGATTAKVGARKGQQKEEQQQPTLGPVQFLQQMMSTNCMAGTGLSDLLKEDEESSHGSSSYDYSSSAVSASSEDTGQSSGNNRRQRQPKGRSSRGRQTKASSQSMNTSTGVKFVNKKDKRNRRGGSSSSGSRGGSRGGRRGGSGSKLSGRPYDIPEEETEEDSAAAAVARLEAEDLNVIGRRPGVGVVRDDGSPTSKQRTPKQTNRKSIRPAVSEKEGSYVTQLRLFSKFITEKGFPLAWHMVQDEDFTMQPTEITAFLILDDESSDPCLTWDIFDLGTQTISARGSIGLFDIGSVEKADAVQLQAYPSAVPGNSFFVTLHNGGVILFEAKDESQQESFIHGLRWVVARLAFNLIVGNSQICTELGLLGEEAHDEEVDEVCDQITNRLLDVSGRHVNTVIANAPMES